jgi:hypothetical protein
VGSHLSGIASYHLLFFHPRPEDGDRICIGLLFSAGRDSEVLYDSSFSKLRCVAPAAQLNLLRFYLASFQAELHKSPESPELLLRRLSPQLSSSEARKVRWPLTESLRLQLLHRFAFPAEAEGKAPKHAREALADEVKQRIRDIVSSLAAPSREIKFDASPEWVLGRKLANVKPVAVALRDRGRVVLIDGIDLNLLTPRGAVSRANEVVHTFWQYGRLDQLGVPFESISSLRRIGLVLNGKTRPGLAYKDAHDFALDQFKKESELAVDASSPEAQSRLAAELTSA